MAVLDGCHYADIASIEINLSGPNETLSYHWLTVITDVWPSQSYWEILVYTENSEQWG